VCGIAILATGMSSDKIQVSDWPPFFKTVFVNENGIVGIFHSLGRDVRSLSAFQFSTIFLGK